MNIIDAHLHYSKIDSFRRASEANCVDYTYSGYIKERAENGIIAGVAMGLQETGQGDFPDLQVLTPMTLDLDIMPEQLYFCAGINPHHLDEKAFQGLENALGDARCVGIKIYAGYYHFDVNDRIYETVYTLATEYDVPVIFHSGDTYSERGLLKYSHPLALDELAVNHPEMKIIIAHLGNPWLPDTAEILYKNRNVYADLSGLQVGDQKLFDRFCNQELYMNMFRTALILADHYDKLLFGTDWPLAPMEVYINFIKKLNPQEHWEKVFYQNALKVFSRIKLKT